MADDKTPFDDDPSEYDDFVFGAGVADGIDTVEKLDDSVAMGPPLGKQELYLKTVSLSEDKETRQPQEQPFECWINGDKLTYNAYKLSIDLAMVDDPDRSVRVTFRLPPGMGQDPSRQDEVDLYMKATGRDVKATSKNTGVHWRQLKQFLSHLGLPILPDGSLPSFTGKTLRFWPDGQRRTIIGDIDFQKDMDGNVTRFKTVAMYGYSDSLSTLANKKMMGTGSAPNGPTPSHSPTPASKGGGRGKSKAQAAVKELDDVEV